MKKKHERLSITQKLNQAKETIDLPSPKVHTAKITRMQRTQTRLSFILAFQKLIAAAQEKRRT